MPRFLFKLEKENEMKFNWRYAVNKLLALLTSRKTVAIVASTLFAVFGFELTDLVQAYIVSGAGLAISVLILLDSILDKTPPPIE